jgi:hypothetical protein
VEAPAIRSIFQGSIFTRKYGLWKSTVAPFCPEIPLTKGSVFSEIRWHSWMYGYGVPRFGNFLDPVLFLILIQPRFEYGCCFWFCEPFIFTEYIVK